MYEIDNEIDLADIKVATYKMTNSWTRKVISHTPRTFFSVICEGSPHIEKFLKITRFASVPLGISCCLLAMEKTERDLTQFALNPTIGKIGEYDVYSTNYGEIVAYNPKYECYVGLSALYSHFIYTKGECTLDFLSFVKQAMTIKVSEVDVNLHYISSYVRAIAIFGEMMEVPKITRHDVGETQEDMVTACFGAGRQSGFYSTGSSLIDMYQFPLIYSNKIKEKTVKMPVARIKSFEPLDLELFEAWKNRKGQFLTFIRQTQEGDDGDIESYFPDEFVANVVVDCDSDDDMEILPLEMGEEEEIYDDYYTEKMKQQAELDDRDLLDIDNEIVDVSMGFLECHVADHLAQIDENTTIIVAPEMNLGGKANTIEVREITVNMEPLSLVAAHSRLNLNKSVFLLDFIENSQGVQPLTSFLDDTVNFKGDCFWLTYAISRVDSFCKIAKTRMRGFFNSRIYNNSSFFDAFRIEGNTLRDHCDRSSEDYDLLFDNHAKALRKLKNKRYSCYVLASYGLMAGDFEEGEMTPEFFDFRFKDKKDMTQWANGTRWLIYIIWLRHGRSSLTLGAFKMKLI